MLLRDELKKIGAPEEFIQWVGEKDRETFWRTCLRADWMLWYVAWLGVDKRLVVKATASCARLALPYIPETWDGPRRTIEMAEKWAEGKATLDEVNTAENEAGEQTMGLGVQTLWLVKVTGDYTWKSKEVKRMESVLSAVNAAKETARTISWKPPEWTGIAISYMPGALGAVHTAAEAAVNAAVNAVGGDAWIYGMEWAEKEVKKEWLGKKTKAEWAARGVTAWAVKMTHEKMANLIREIIPIQVFSSE